MEIIRTQLGFSGKGRCGLPPQGAKILSVQGKVEKRGEMFCFEKGAGKVIFEWRGEVYYYERTCLFYIPLSVEAHRKTLEGSHWLCYYCLLMQAMRNLTVSLDGRKDLHSQLLEVFQKKKYKCPFGYSLKAQRAASFLEATMRPERIVAAKAKGQRGFVLYRREKPFPLQVRVQISDRQKEKATRI